MPKKTLYRIASVLAASGLAGCVAGGGEPLVLPPLAQDQDQPVLALFEHVLAGYFAGTGTSGPTTCASLRPGGLTAEQEQALIVRFVRLAPAARCRTEGNGRVDTLTGGPAAAIEVYDFACRDETQCTGWASVPGRPATRYALRFEQGAWRIDGDTRIIAE